MRDGALERAITEAGGTAALARTINVTPQAISQWDRVPAERALAVEQATGGKVTRHELRPDIYPAVGGVPPVATTQAGPQKWVYTFGAGKAEGTAAMKDLLGGKGANLAEMSGIGVPVPPGFTITTEVCTYYYANGKQYPAALKAEIERGIAEVEKVIGGPKFGSELKGASDASAGLCAVSRCTFQPQRGLYCLRHCWRNDYEDDPLYNSKRGKILLEILLKKAI